ncbi:EAL domain-containing protein [Roseibium sp. RKSG952]|uniref:EAL domain-containing protein n=1 Tax=Roseibium sp. RKSG952 TaxID=2529384 RepID=UPI0012BB4F2D|nr:EAL domain-containing protein [Roseibium sp. RKSG952]MTH97231.1 EAL domain-containing protein [Roseibium sp. RKSG952]
MKFASLAGIRVSGRYFSFIRTIGIAILLAMAPLLFANTSLDHFARTQTLSEMEAIAKRHIKRAEDAIAQVVSVLQRLDRDAIVTCRAEDREIYQRLVGELGMIDAIGLADTEGRRMCVAPDKQLDGKAVLPPLRENAPRVGIGMLDREYLGAKAALISWELGNSLRLFAELTPAVIASDPGPDYLRAFRRVEMSLDNDLLWFASGAAQQATAGDGSVLVSTAASQNYPLNATVSAPLSAALHSVHGLKVITAAFSAVLALVLVGAGVWLSWRPESEADLEFAAAVGRGEFIPYYQPVIDIETGHLRGCEVLMRWRRPNGVLVSPGQFMAYAETYGHIFDMTRSIMVQCRDELGAYYAGHPDLKLSINLFAGHFLDREIIDDLKETFEGSGISFQQIIVEVTERHPLVDMELAREIIGELQSLGIRVALDDVGTGHGGMAYLQKLGVNIIKIDKMFIDALGTDASSTTIVDSMVELADNLGMGIIAEGVELQEQIDRLLDLGVTAAQGYLFAAAMPAGAFLEYAQRLEDRSWGRAGGAGSTNVPQSGQKGQAA